MTVLDVRLLGVPSIRSGSSQISLRPVELQLFAFLLMHRGKPVSRDAVAAALWQDGADEACRRRLSTALWRLRARVDGHIDSGDSCVASDGYGNLFVDGGAVDLDVALFEADAECAPRADGGLHPGDATRLRRAVGRYGGDLLEGVYDDWVLRERERLLGVYLSALTRLMRWHQRRGEPEAAIAMARGILDRDPLREDVHRALIRCYSQTGARTRALDQYQRCKQLLRDELGVDPLPETTATAVAVLRGRSPAPPSAPVPAPDLLGPLLQVRDQVDALRDAVDSAITQLRSTGPDSRPADRRSAPDR